MSNSPNDKTKGNETFWRYSIIFDSMISSHIHIVLPTVAVRFPLPFVDVKLIVT